MKDDAPNILAKGWMIELREELATVQQTVFPILKYSSYLPDKRNIFRAFQTLDIDQVEVVIVGQDPYFQPGVATGLAFASRGPAPASLVNILKEVERNTGHFMNFDKTDLEGWAQQGVLLLNRVLTVQPGQPNSHSNIGWQQFTDAAIRAVSKRQPRAFLLWGSNAHQVKDLIHPKHLVLQATHPSPQSASKGWPHMQAFNGCRHFTRVNEWRTQNGEEPIKWERT